jgi:hypothetical protein
MLTLQVCGLPHPALHASDPERNVVELKQNQQFNSSFKMSFIKLPDKTYGIVRLMLVLRKRDLKQFKMGHLESANKCMWTQ